MAFRSDREALRQRVHDLEDDLRARDDELARVQAELERAKADEITPEKPAKRSRNKLAFRLLSKTTPESEPVGDRWTIPKSEPSRAATFLLLLWPAIFLFTLGPRLLRGESGAWSPFLIFVPLPILMLLYKSGADIDRRARTVTVWRQLIVRWERKLPLDGPKLHIETTLVSPKNGDSYWAGRIMLGDQLLAVRKDKQAKSLAQRIAKFAEVPYSSR